MPSNYMGFMQLTKTIHIYIILFQNVKDLTPLDTNTLKFVPRQLRVPPHPESKIKKPNRIIFH